MIGVDLFLVFLSIYIYMLKNGHYLKSCMSVILSVCHHQMSRHSAVNETCMHTYIHLVQYICLIDLTIIMYAKNMTRMYTLLQMVGLFAHPQK